MCFFGFDGIILPAEWDYFHVEVFSCHGRYFVAIKPRAIDNQSGLISLSFGVNHSTEFVANNRLDF